MQILYLYRFDGLNPTGVIQGKKQTQKQVGEKCSSEGERWGLINCRQGKKLDFSGI